MRPVTVPAAAQGPLAVMMPHVLGWPWWALLPVALAWPLVYICRQILVFRLGSKALEKGGREQASEIVAAITGHDADRPRRPGKGRRR
jgi:hypothetical protein